MQFHTRLKALINTEALARWVDALRTRKLFQQFAPNRGMPLKRLECTGASLHRPKTTVLMRACRGACESSRPLAALVAVLAGCYSCQTSGADWPQWRGPRRDGVCQETGLLKEWPPAGPPLLWKARGLGNGYSTVSIVGDRLYSCGDKDDQSFVIALNLADGTTAWTARLGKGGDVGGFVGPRATPTLDGDLVYAVSQSGELVCLEAATGKQRWHKFYSTDFNGTEPQWGYAESALVDGNKVVATPGGSQGAIVALDKTTGAVLWRTPEFTDGAHYSSLIAAEIGGVKQYIQLTAASVAGIDAATGKLLWRTTRRGQTAVVPTPIYSDRMVYVSSGYGVGCNLFKVTENVGKFFASQVYANKVMVNHHGGVIKIGDFIYGYSDGKGWTCQDFKTGEARWQQKDRWQGKDELGKGCLAYADGHFYLRLESSGTMILIDASPDGYKEHGRFTPPDRSSERAWSHPVIAGGKLYLRDQDVLLCYDLAAK